MISLQKKFLFVHVPKTGGNSIQNILRRWSEDEILIKGSLQDGVERFELRSAVHPELKKHSTLAQYGAALGARRLEGLYRFAVARNPWDRMISYYFSPHRQAPPWDRAAFLALLEQLKPLRHFIGLDPQRPLGAELDFLLRFEQLEADFAQVCAVLGLPPEPLPRRNASARGHYSQYYDAELRAIVGERYREEIEELGYRFEEP